MWTYRSCGAFAAAVVLVVGCSGNDTDESERPPPTPPADVTTPSTVSEPNGDTTTIVTTTTPLTSTTVPATTPAAEPTMPSEEPGWDPVDSRTGRWMAFVSARTGAGELFVVDLETGEERQLTTFGGTDTIYQVTWSPDGSAIAFQCPSDLPPADPDGAGLGPSDICVFDVATGELVNVTGDPETDQTPAWSPDGRELAFFTFGESGPQVRVAERGGASKRIVAEGGSPAWSPDGTEIALTGPAGAVIAVEPAGGSERLIAQSGTPGASPVWSPDGAELAFECLTEGADPDALPLPTDICIVAADGTDVRVLADVATTDSAPTWSPDGSTIAFTAREWAGFDATPGEIHVVPAVGGPARRVADGTDPVWSPDGTSLAFARVEGGVALVDIATGAITTVIVDPSAREVTWAPAVVPAG